jgi:hypothetical protein
MLSFSEEVEDTRRPGDGARQGARVAVRDRRRPPHQGRGGATITCTIILICYDHYIYVYIIYIIYIPSLFAERIPSNHRGSGLGRFVLSSMFLVCAGVGGPARLQPQRERHIYVE